MACWLGSAVEPAWGEMLSARGGLALGEEVFLREGLTVGEPAEEILELGAEPNCLGAAPKARSGGGGIAITPLAGRPECPGTRRAAPTNATSPSTIAAYASLGRGNIGLPKRALLTLRPIIGITRPASCSTPSSPSAAAVRLGTYPNSLRTATTASPTAEVLHGLSLDAEITDPRNTAGAIGHSSRTRPAWMPPAQSHLPR